MMQNDSDKKVEKKERICMPLFAGRWQEDVAAAVSVMRAGRALHPSLIAEDLGPKRSGGEAASTWRKDGRDTRPGSKKRSAKSFCRHFRREEGEERVTILSLTPLFALL